MRDNIVGHVAGFVLFAIIVAGAFAIGLVTSPTPAAPVQEGLEAVLVGPDFDIYQFQVLEPSGRALVPIEVNCVALVHRHGAVKLDCDRRGSAPI